MKRSLPLLVLSLFASTLLLASGCPKKGGKQTGDGGSDAGPVDAGPPPPPARELVSWRLFGDMPLDNGVLDPQLRATGFSWFAFTMRGVDVDIVRREHAHAPSGQPIVELPKSDVGGAPIMFAGLARGGAAPRAASVWIGRPADQADFSAIDVSLLAFDAGAAADRAFELVVDSSTGSMFEQDGVMWQRRLATVDRDLFGWTMLVISDASEIPLFVTGPVVASVATRTGIYLPVAPAAVRETLRPGEVMAVAKVKAALRDRLQLPAKDEAARHHRETSKRALEALLRSSVRR